MPGNEPWENRFERLEFLREGVPGVEFVPVKNLSAAIERGVLADLSLIHISEPPRPY